MLDLDEDAFNEVDIARTLRVVMFGHASTPRSELIQRLESLGASALVHSDASLAIQEVRRTEPDFLILNAGGKTDAALAITKRVRKFSQVPILLLTHAQDELNHILALRLGIDMVERSPASARLLMEKMSALLRRVRLATEPSPTERRIIRRGPLKLDLECHTVSWRDREVTLTHTEIKVLNALVDRPMHIRSRDQLHSQVYGTNIHVEERTIDSHIKRLRNKLRDVDPEFNAIETLYGIGYRFRDAE